jgi:hypothetical protein
MHGRAAASLLRGAGKASWRFVVQIAASFVATLCVTLVLSGWLRPRADTAPAPATTPAPVESSSAPSSFASSVAPSRVFEANAQGDEGVGIARSPSAMAPMDRVTATRIVDAAPVTPVAQARAHSPQKPKATPHGASPTCATPCLGHSSSPVANLEPSRQAPSDPQAGTLAIATPDEGRHSGAFAFAVPAVPMPAVFVRSLRPVLHGASSVADLLTGLAGKL